MATDTRIVGTVFVKPVEGASFVVSPPTSTFNSFGQASVGPAMFGTIVSFTPSSATKLVGVVGWGDTDAEYVVLIGGVEVGGFRTSPSHRSVQISYKQAPIDVGAGITVEVKAKHELAQTVSLKANILGGI